MKLTIEQQLRKQKHLIITKHNYQFVQLLKNQLKKYDANIFVSPELPDDISSYSLCFFINEPQILLTELVKQAETKFVFIFFNQDKIAQTTSAFINEHKAFHIKVINLETSPQFYAQDIDTILWFTFSRSEETFLHIYHPKLSPPPLPARPAKVKKPLFPWSKEQLLKPKTLIIAGFVLMLITNILFVPPLLLSTWLHAQAAKALITKDYETSKKYQALGKDSLEVGKSFYSISRPILLFFSLALPSDDLFQLNESAQTVLSASVSLQEKAQTLTSRLMMKNKAPEEINQFMAEKEEMIVEFQQLHQNVTILSQKIPGWTDQLTGIKKDLDTTSKTFDTVERLLPHLDSIFARGTTKKYLLLFANNMELRPGGGFIGSFAVITVKDYTIEELKVYDVYDADGQLEAHVDPPQAISQYLEQPHWFLRDSAFSPDFIDNYNQALFFLDKELDLNNFDGGILLTTTSVQNILESLGSLYVPDFQESVTKDNFYIKAQLYAEKDFFPGSLQKKRFLTSVMNQLLIDIERASFTKLFQMLKKSLDEKQMVVYMKDENVQNVFNDLYWSGRVLSPICARANTPNCVVDYLLPFDANLGVNKANFFISRPMYLDVTIDKNGRIEHTLTFKYKNDSYADVFPGGNYKNYFQLLLPNNSVIKEITVDGNKLDAFDQKDEIHKTIGFLMEVPPQTAKEIKVSYQLEQNLQNGNGMYQMMLQKQIGSKSSDIELTINLPSNIYVVNKNFSPLVKGNQMIYNTTITSDKIFLLEFYKE